MTIEERPLFDDPDPPVWTDDDFPVDDLDVEITDIPMAGSLDEVNRDLRRMTVLARRVAEYNRLEQQDLERLKRRRADTADKWSKRFKDIEANVKAFAVAAYRRTGTFSWPMPNGSIKSSSVMDEMKVDDVLVADFVAGLSWTEPLYEYRPKVFVKPLRAVLDKLEAEGVVQRFIAGPGEDEVAMVEPGKRVTEPLRPDQVGRWMMIEGGETIEGLSWQPNGDDGVGRNFRIEL